MLRSTKISLNLTKFTTTRKNSLRKLTVQVTGENCFTLNMERKFWFTNNAKDPFDLS